jgi:serine/threonine protein kinase
MTRCWFVLVGQTFAHLSFFLSQIFRCESSILWECVHRESGQRYCVKIFDRRRLGSVQEQEAVEREINFLQNAQGHMGIVQLLDVIDDSEKVYVIMELMTGGNLLSKVVQQEGLCESTVKMIAKTLLLSVRHLHQLEICHNGLEPSNILLDATDGAKIGDFGHASRMGHMTGSPGTAAYMAPEVLQGVAPNAASDMWSIGVLLYFCFFGQAPFVDQSAASSRAITSSRIHNTYYSFPTTEWNHVPRYAKQLISSLIHMDPTVRLTANEALEHPWFADPVVEPVHSRRRPRRIRAVVQCLWEKMSLCRKKKDIKELASLSTNSSSPYSDRSIKHGHTREESASSMNRFYDIEG